MSTGIFREIITGGVSSVVELTPEEVAAITARAPQRPPVPEPRLAEIEAELARLRARA